MKDMGNGMMEEQKIQCGIKYNFSLIIENNIKILNNYILYIIYLSNIRIRIY